MSQPLGFSTPKTLSYVAANIVTALEALGLLPMEHLEPGRELPARNNIDVLTRQSNSDA